MAVPAQITGEAANELREGIDLLLGRWSALQMAIRNEWGGRDTRHKVEQLADDLYHWLITPAEALYVDDLENLLDDFMLSLNTEIDDGSIEEISDNLMIMHEECLEASFASIERQRQAIPAANHRMQVVISGEDDSDSTSTSGDESMEMADELDDPSSNISAMTLGEPPRPHAPTVDADGWTVVSSRRNHESKEINQKAENKSENENLSQPVLAQEWPSLVKVSCVNPGTLDSRKMLILTAPSSGSGNLGKCAIYLWVGKDFRPLNDSRDIPETNEGCADPPDFDMKEVISDIPETNEGCADPPDFDMKEVIGDIPETNEGCADPPDFDMKKVISAVRIRMGRTKDTNVKVVQQGKESSEFLALLSSSSTKSTRDPAIPL